MRLSVLLLSLAVLASASHAPALAQQPPAGVAVLKFNWHKERIRQRASAAPVETYATLREQGLSDARLQASRNAQNKEATSRNETATFREDEAKAKARQADLPLDGYRYNVTLRNDCDKVIKSVDWDYVFIDPVTQKEAARHQFTSDETIKPGKSREVSVLYLIPPVKTVNVKMLDRKSPLRFEERVVVARILFSDGSVWQRP